MTIAQDNFLNVTLLEPRVKHPTIFARFDELKEGETLFIQNDHDPKPLYYQLIAERGDIFTWDYLEKGPEWWKIKIQKRITGEGEETLGEMAAKDMRKVEVFKKFGLDFCCEGKKTIKQACADLGLDLATVERELQQADKNPTAQALPYNDWDLDFFADFIVNTHHRYIRANLPDILQYAQKVKEVHGNQHPELVKINELVKAVATAFMEHLEEEEQVLFPKIKSLVQKQRNQQTTNQEGAEKLQQSVESAEEEHQFVGKTLDEIQKLSNNYTLPEDTCASYELLYRKLHELEDDTHIHIHLENNLLFPKAIELEKQLLKK